MRYLLLLVAAGLNAAANLLMKAGARGLPPGAPLTQALTRPALWAGLVCFGLSLVGYTASLRQFEISVAYPVMVGIGFAVVVSMAALFFQEPLSAKKAAGIALIFLGVWLAAR